MLMKAAENKINEINRRLELKKEYKGPKLLLVAELFLAMAAGLYLLKMILISGDLSAQGDDRILSLLMFGVNILMMFLAIHAAFGVSSKRISSWCTVVRNCGLLFIVSMLTYFTQIRLGVGADVTFDPILAGVIAIPVILIMLLPNVREFYMPPMAEKKPLVNWIMCLFGIRMYSSDEYELKYE